MTQAIGAESILPYSSNRPIFQGVREHITCLYSFLSRYFLALLRLLTMSVNPLYLSFCSATTDRQLFDSFDACCLTPELSATWRVLFTYTLQSSTLYLFSVCSLSVTVARKSAADIALNRVEDIVCCPPLYFSLVDAHDLPAV